LDEVEQEVEEKQPLKEEKPQKDQHRESAPKEKDGNLPPISFSQFIMSLATNALIFMGATPHPETGETMTDLASARQTIDILGMLREKTKGNLTAEEEKFFDNLLAQLRLTFVQRGK
jgi:hypothetical protein